MLAAHGGRGVGRPLTATPATFDNNNETERRNIMDAEKIAYDFAYDGGLGTEKEIVGWLAWIVKDVEDCMAEREDVEEYLHEIADSSVPIYTCDKMSLMAASNTLASTVPDIADGCEQTPSDIAGLVLYETACEMAYVAFREVTALRP
jgi:hypothetical protein